MFRKSRPQESHPALTCQPTSYVSTPTVVGLISFCEGYPGGLLVGQRCGERFNAGGGETGVVMWPPCGTEVRWGSEGLDGDWDWEIRFFGAFLNFAALHLSPLISGYSFAVIICRCYVRKHCHDSLSVNPASRKGIPIQICASIRRIGDMIRYILAPKTANRCIDYTCPPSAVSPSSLDVQLNADEFIPPPLAGGSFWVVRRMNPSSEYEMRRSASGWQWRAHYCGSSSALSYFWVNLNGACQSGGIGQRRHTNGMASEDFWTKTTILLRL
ncbi:hypothetical protein B0H14DRAFT_2625082 [Mycena olivaceomarginata]|nr:hypothetical protein B0H14DRAFT_2625082 [Mycena olivaceomarginata]